MPACSSPAGTAWADTPEIVSLSVTEPDSTSNVKIASPEGEAVISPLAGASLRSLRVRVDSGSYELLSGGDTVHDPSSLPDGTGSFVMAPWANRILRGELHAADGDHSLPVNSGLHAIHGLVRNIAWQVEEQSENHVTCRTDLRAPWPWSGRVTQTTELVGRSLRQTLVVESGSAAFPASCGWHPWFNRTLDGQANVSVQAGVTDQWELDDSITPSGVHVKTPFVDRLVAGTTFKTGEVDDCFTLAVGGAAQLVWPEVTLTLTPGDSVSHLMVYSPEHALCVEPQTATVNPFQLADRGVQDTGAAVVEPGSPLAASATWSW